MPVTGLLPVFLKFVRGNELMKTFIAPHCHIAGSPLVNLSNARKNHGGSHLFNTNTRPKVEKVTIRKEELNNSIHRTLFWEIFNWTIHVRIWVNIFWRAASKAAAALWAEL